MKVRNILGSLLLCVLLLLQAACVSSGSATKALSKTSDISGSETRQTDQQETVLPENETVASRKAAAQKEMNEAIAKAVADAKKSGSTRADINLDKISGIVGKGDLVTLRYTAVLEDGTALVGRNADDVTGMQQASIVAGRPGRIPGLDQSVIGMVKGEKRQLTILPEEAFGRHEAKKEAVFASVRTFPLFMQIPSESYRKKFGTLPALGDDVPVTPYFKSIVREVSEDNIGIENMARDGLREKAPFGTTTVRVQDRNVSIVLEPVKGAPFAVGKQTGTIVKVEKDRFTVDFNHPFAGQKLFLDVEVVDFTKAAVFEEMAIPWIEDHDQGYEASLKSHKNKVLVLYAEWCQWCKKLFHETMTDPRITIFKDDFIWVRADSDKDPSLKTFYKQDGFPMIVLTDGTGTILKKMEGFKDAEQLAAELKKISAQDDLDNEK